MHTTYIKGSALTSIGLNCKIKMFGENRLDHSTHFKSQDKFINT